MPFDICACAFDQGSGRQPSAPIFITPVLKAAGCFLSSYCLSSPPGTVAPLPTYPVRLHSYLSPHLTRGKLVLPDRPIHCLCNLLTVLSASAFRALRASYLYLRPEHFI